MPYVTKETGARLTKLIIVGMVCFVLVVVYVYISFYQVNDTITTNLQKGCERGKLDRRDNAEFQTAHAKYINKVVIAQSVKEDIKDAAREALKTYERTAPSLTERSQIDCSKAFPKESIWPW